MSEENNKKDQGPKPMHHSGHHPKSRREFLAQGFLGVSALAFAPELLLKNAKAQHNSARLLLRSKANRSRMSV